MVNGMDKYIHRENLALVRRRLAEAQDETTRRMAQSCLAETFCQANPASVHARLVPAHLPAMRSQKFRLRVDILDIIA